MTPTPQSLDTVTLEAAARKVESYKMVSADASATVNTVNRIYDELAAAIRALAIKPTPAGEGEAPSPYYDLATVIGAPGEMKFPPIGSPAPAASPVQGVEEKIADLKAVFGEGEFFADMDKYRVVFNPAGNHFVDAQRVVAICSTDNSAGKMTHAIAVLLNRALTATPQAPSTVDERVKK